MRTIDKLIDQCNSTRRGSLSEISAKDLQMYLDNEGIEIVIKTLPCDDRTEATLVLLAMVLNLAKRVEELERGDRE
ncbi:MAG: hypothetical protein ACRCYB_08340 [Aeromonas veronii]